MSAVGPRYGIAAGITTLLPTLPLTAQLTNVHAEGCWENVSTTATVNVPGKVVAQQ